MNKWMIANKLTLNMSKSNATIINSNKNGKSSKNCYNEVLPIMIVKNAKYLGVTFDGSLSFDCCYVIALHPDLLYSIFLILNLFAFTLRARSAGHFAAVAILT